MFHFMKRINEGQKGCQSPESSQYVVFSASFACSSILFLMMFLLAVWGVGCTIPDRLDFEPTHLYKPVENPVLSPDSSLVFTDPVSQKRIQWQKADVFNPAAIVKDGRIFLLYRCEDNPAAAIGGRTSRLGLAVSDDGLHFKKYPVPVLYPDTGIWKQFDYPGGCEDPRLVQSADGLFVVVYTSWNNKVARLSTAFSKDLFHWQKKGPAFAAKYESLFAGGWSKSGSIVTEIKNGKQLAAKINGKYWMYWGEHLINLAWSVNLADWNPVLNQTGTLLSLAAPRPKKFDSDLTECGPPAIVTVRGIMLLYNGKNATGANADPLLQKGTYSTGEIIFDKNDPSKILERSDTSFLKPSLPFELTGQYSAGTTFAEGLVFFKRRWFLYYGTADSFVGVAVSK
jgi:predicted GH43/DUF377 family glycosyl hydrolase